LICTIDVMDANARLGALIDVLQRDGRVDVAEAAVVLGTAEMTIRRDLDRMVALGMARRVRGGATSLLTRGEELPFALRVVEHQDAKVRMAAAVAEMVGDGEAVALDSGTTTVEIARALVGRHLTVMPMSLHAAALLSEHPWPRVLVPGGETRPGELAMVGPLALASIESLCFDTAVVSCCGLSDGRVTTHDLGDSAVKQAIVGASSRAVLVADSSKFRQSAMAVVGMAATFDALVTDTDAPPGALETLRAAGVEVRCV
jgi:DeoR/GlpR family transcriptional regulator of sugar metabolism